MGSFTATSLRNKPCPAETLLLLKTFLGLFKGDRTVFPEETSGSSSSPRLAHDPSPSSWRVLSRSADPGAQQLCLQSGLGSPCPRARAQPDVSGARGGGRWSAGRSAARVARRVLAPGTPGCRPAPSAPWSEAGDRPPTRPPRGNVLLTRACGLRARRARRGRGAMSCLPGRVVALLLGLLVECTEAKKHCWYFEGLYPTYYICRPYEDCCGSRCCVRALSIQRLWYFWFLLMMGVLFCCGAGFFIRRRMYPPPLIEEPAFNVSYTRQPPNPAPGSQQPGLPYYSDPGGLGMNPAGNPMAMAFQVQPNSPQGSTAYPPPPSYCNTPPPPYEQVVKAK
ncbi:vesicular, overexpressed in cancer, prosurvival protein 1 [Equus quagga]|uniref:vesicular, overexpressed in cancer, prosurvival protein 1 n=1 Tax=Equus quagga TaxID=89248 RepID=UPI001EE1C2B5|nr:vesicular, overexpressed in cancer, prosurvival protein 1 [Equus quagga]